jgi:hypothetical protein
MKSPVPMEVPKFSMPQALRCEHQFQIVRTHGRPIPGVMVCEFCGHRVVYRTTKSRQPSPEAPLVQPTAETRLNEK